MSVLKSDLTLRQEEILEFIIGTIVTRGIAPTLREIGAAFGIGSPNGVACHLRALERKGMISREEGRSRGLVVRGMRSSSWSLPFGGEIS